MALGGNPGSQANPSSAQTNMLYTGQQWDKQAQMYYLRARYYDTLNGRFSQMDTFAGSPDDPQSLHKYIYCHNNPVNGIDPSGHEFSLTGLAVSMTIGMTVMSLLIPVLGAAYLAMRGKISILQLGKYLLNPGVWAAALSCLIGGAATTIVAQKILFKFGLKVAEVGNIIIGFLSAAWGLAVSIKMTWDMVTGELPPSMAELYIAIMVAGIILTVGLKSAMSSGKFKEFLHTGGEGDAEYWNLTAEEQANYDRGQSILPSDIHRKLTQGNSVAAACSRGREIASLDEGWLSARGSWEVLKNSFTGGEFTASDWLNTGATPQVRFLFDNCYSLFGMMAGSLNTGAAIITE